MAIKHFDNLIFFATPNPAKVYFPIVADAKSLFPIV